MHLPGYEYCGPFTPTREKMRRGIQPRNRVDALSLQHDLDYEEAKSYEDRRLADKKLIEDINSLVDLSCEEKIGAFVVKLCMRIKLLLRV